MKLDITLTPEQTAGLASVTAKANVGSPAPLTDEQFLTASINGLLDGWAASSASERAAQAAVTFSAQPLPVQEALLATDDWSGITN
jgi:hypothetical protein